VGELQARLGWFATYGVRECWLVHQDEQTVEIVTCVGGDIGRRQTFGAHVAMHSDVLPDRRESLTSVLAE
jgi:hypothetical protein